MGSMEQQPLRLAILGGGIGGLSLLLGLIQHTSPSVIQPHLYESAAAFSEIGAGVAFGPNAVRAMKLVDPRLHDAYTRIASRAPIFKVNGQDKVAWHHMYMAMDGKTSQNQLKTLEEVQTPYNDNRFHNVHRASFLNEMINLVPNGGKQHTSFRKRCVDIQEDPDTSELIIFFKDGTTARADAIIGCDGVKSRTRQILLKDYPESLIQPRYTGQYAYRGLVPIEDAKAAIGDFALKNITLLGYDGHLVCFPIDHGKTLNIVAFHSSPRKADGTFEDWPHGGKWVVPATTEAVLEDFKDFGEPIKNLLGLLKKPEQWALFDHAAAPFYQADGRIAILGDSAHASTPHQGAGAAMAIEDAAVFSRLLKNVQSAHDTDSLKIAFEIYDELRRPRSQNLVTTSRDCGLMYQFQKPGVQDNVEALRALIKDRYNWLWDYHPEEQVIEADEMMRQRLAELSEQEYTVMPSVSNIETPSVLSLNIQHVLSKVTSNSSTASKNTTVQVMEISDDEEDHSAYIQQPPRQVV